MTAPAAPRCPYSRHFSYRTGEYSISLDYAGLTELMDHVFNVWDLVETKAHRDGKPPPEPGSLAASIVVDDERIGNAFDALVEHVAGLREWTGWDGVPAEYTVAPDGEAATSNNNNGPTPAPAGPQLARTRTRGAAGDPEQQAGERP